MSQHSVTSAEPGGNAPLPYIRVLLASKVVFLAGIPLAIVLMLASGVSHLSMPSAAYMVVIAIAFLSLAVGEAVRMRLLFVTGQWRALSGGIVRRQERPDRFRGIVVLHGVVMLAYLGVVALAIWIVAGGA